MAHITGGGITGNLPRVLPRNVQAVIELGSWPVLPIFRYLARIGKIEPEELLRTFNMGVGMILIVPPKNVSKTRIGIEAPPRELLPHRTHRKSAPTGKPRVNGLLRFPEHPLRFIGVNGPRRNSSSLFLLARIR